MKLYLPSPATFIVVRTAASVTEKNVAYVLDLQESVNYYFRSLLHLYRVNKVFSSMGYQGSLLFRFRRRY